MTVINRQIFISELGKLLAFMHEDDRKLALAMYDEMFESCANEEMLIARLSSPTRQAVIVARAYDSKNRSGKREAYGSSVGMTPSFVEAIESIMEQVVADNRRQPDVSEDQFSLFQDDSRPHVNLNDDATESSFEPEAASEGTSTAEKPVQAAAAGAIKTLTVDDFLADLYSEDALEAQEDDSDADAQIPVYDAEAHTIPAADQTAADGPDAVDRFLTDFSISDDESSDAATPEYTSEDFAGDPVSDAEAADDAIRAKKDSFYYDDEPEYRANPALLIPYILIAIPLTLCGTAILLIPAVLFLALGVACVAAGVFAVSSAFSGLSMFSDMMIVLGTAVAALALGLLFLWTSIWFVGGAIVGLFRGVIHLGKKLCFKEVQE